MIKLSVMCIFIFSILIDKYLRGNYPNVYTHNKLLTRVFREEKKIV